MKFNVFKKSVLALSVAGLMVTTSVNSRSVDVTDQLKGARPVIEAVQVQGTLKVGSTLSIPDYYLKGATEFNLMTGITDTDGDAPLSVPQLNELVNNPGDAAFDFIVPANKDHIEWFLVPETYDEAVDGTKENWLTQAQFNEVKGSLVFFDGSEQTVGDKTVTLPDFRGMQTITLPAIAAGKRIGFKITARTATGYPIDAEPVYVMNAFLPSGEGPSDPKKDDKPDGSVDLWTSKLVVQTRALNSTDEWETILNEGVNAYDNINLKDEELKRISVVNSEFRAMIFDENGNSIDHLYKSPEAFAFRFVAKVDDTYNGKPLTADDLASEPFQTAFGLRFNNYMQDNGEDYFKFTVQDINESSKILPLIEQGLRISIDINDDKADVTVTNPDETSPISAIVQ